MHRTRGTDTRPPAEPDATANSRRSLAEALLARLTAQQHGVVTRVQLVAGGLSDSGVDNLLRSGRVERLHPGVYRCARSEPTPWTRAAAATVAATGVHGWRDESGRITAAVSHRLAAVLRSYLPADAGEGASVDVSGRPVRRTPGVRVHQTELDRSDAVLLKGIPVTSPARTLLDLAGVATMRELEQALAVAEKSRRTVRGEVERLLEARPLHRGSGMLRRLLGVLAATCTEPLHLRSRAEEVAWDILGRLRLPLPLANQEVLGLEVDFHWPELRLVLEVDGFEFHGGPEAFHRDRERDRSLALAGYQVLRLTWRQLVEDPLGTAAALSAAYARREEMLRRT